MTAAVPQKFGCHVDLEPGDKPDSDCVIDYGDHRGCNMAMFANGRLRRAKHTCPHWKPIAKDQTP